MSRAKYLGRDSIQDILVIERGHWLELLEYIKYNEAEGKEWSYRLETDYKEP